MNLSIRYSDRLIFLKGGEIYAAGGPEIVTPETVKEVYGLDTVVETINGNPVVVPI